MIVAVVGSELEIIAANFSVQFIMVTQAALNIWTEVQAGSDLNVRLRHSNKSIHMHN